MSGSTQAGRGQAALSPDSAPVDGRTLAQLHHFVAEFARLVSYIGPDGKADGDWQPFFARDTGFLLAEILCFDADKEVAAVKRIVHEEVEGHRRERKILERIFSLFKQVSDWTVRAHDIGTTAAFGTPAALTLAKLVRQQLQPLYQTIQQDRNMSAQWQAWQLAYLQALPGGTRALLAELWGMPQGDAPARDVHDVPSSQDLRSAHLSFVRYIAAILPPMQDYFDDALQNVFGHQPHTALMTAFLRIFKHAQDAANAFTARHLDFHYRDILQLRERGATPDTAFVCFQAAPGSQGSALPAGTLLRAGKLPDGRDLIYAVDDDLVVNQDKLKSLKTLYARRQPMWAQEPAGPSRVIRLYATPQGDALHGLDAPPGPTAPGWPTFGSDENGGAAGMPAEAGVLITSPMLLLRGGRRALRVRFQYRQEASDMACAPLGAPADARQTARSRGFADVAEAYLAAVNDSYEPAAGLSSPARLRQAMTEACQVWLTTEAGWQRVERMAVRADSARAWVEVVLLLPATFPAIVPGPAAPLEAGGTSPWPRLKLMLSPDARVYAYSFIQQLELTGITLRTAVTGLLPAGMATSLGPVNAASPFPPFGAMPALGNALELKDAELAGKPIVRAALQVNWLNLPQPPQDLTQYYWGYGAPVLRNDSFQARFEICRQGRWVALGNRSLFTAAAQTASAECQAAPATLQTALWFSLNGSLLPGAKAPRPWQGIRMTLVEPAGAFGHERYPQLVATSAMKTAAAITSEALAKALNKAGSATGATAAATPPAPPAPALPALPKPPFVPIARQITVNYVATADLQAVQAPDEISAPLPCYYQLGPFGYRAAPVSGSTLLAGMERAGQLYIGLENLNPGQMVSLLFGMQETAAQHRAVLRTGLEAGHDTPAGRGVDWYYLQDNQWQPFSRRDQVQDGTAGLTRSGIVRLQTHEGRLDGRNTLLPPGLFWLAAMVDDPAARSHLVFAATQAAAATQVLAGPQPLSGGPLPGGTIKDFARKPAGIQGVSQALPTPGGQATENADDFRVRISERLRHKRRALRAVDFEQLALDAFPGILQARCITPASGCGRGYVAGTLAPGSVALVVVPRPPRGSPHAPHPAVSIDMLAQLRATLLQRSAATFKGLRVISPQYEDIKVCLQVDLQPGHDFAYYRRLLSDNIGAWLAPWRMDSAQPLPIGGSTLSMKDLYVFIANHPGVVRVRSLEVLHVFEHAGQRATRWLEQDDALMPSCPWSVLVPAAHHYITDSGDAYGIGRMVIGEDVMTRPAHSPPPQRPAAADRRYTLKIPVALVAAGHPGFNHRDEK